MFVWKSIISMKMRFVCFIWVCNIEGTGKACVKHESDSFELGKSNHKKAEKLTNQRQIIVPV